MLSPLFFVPMFPPGKRHDLMAAFQEFFDEVTADVPGAPSD